MKKALLLIAIAFSSLAFSQPITNISTIKANKLNYFNQGFFVNVTVHAIYNGSKWFVYDATDTVLCDFANVTSPSAGQQITIVALGIDNGNIELEARYYYPSTNPPNLHTTIADIISDPVHGQVVVLNGSVTGILSGSNDDYYFEDNTGTIEADWEILMNVPDYWKPVELWGVVDNSGSYVDINVWAWYPLSSQSIAEEIRDYAVYPNPANAIIHLPDRAFYTHVEVYDITGRKLIQSFPEQQSLDVTSLQCGHYILLMFDDDSIIHRVSFTIGR